MEEPLLTADIIICHAIRAYRLPNGEIDTHELEDFLNNVAGPDAWFMTSVWMFSRAPAVIRPGFHSVPVICPKPASNRLMRRDRESREPVR